MGYMEIFLWLMGNSIFYLLKVAYEHSSQEIVSSDEEKEIAKQPEEGAARQRFRVYCRPLINTVDGGNLAPP